MLRNVIGQRACDRVLQQALIRNQAFAIDRLHLSRVEIHGYHTDENEHTHDYVQNGNARRHGQSKGQSGPWIRRVHTRPEFGYSSKFYVEWNARKGTLERNRVTKVLKISGQ